jgi:hypothetical protein
MGERRQKIESRRQMGVDSWQFAVGGGKAMEER